MTLLSKQARAAPLITYAPKHHANIPQFQKPSPSSGSSPPNISPPFLLRKPQHRIRKPESRIDRTHYLHRVLLFLSLPHHLLLLCLPRLPLLPHLLSRLRPSLLFFIALCLPVCSERLLCRGLGFGDSRGTGTGGENAEGYAWTVGVEEDVLHKV